MAVNDSPYITGVVHPLCRDSIAEVSGGHERGGAQLDVVALVVAVPIHRGGGAGDVAHAHVYGDGAGIEGGEIQGLA